MTFETFVAWKKAKLERMQVGACDDDDDGVDNDNDDTNASALS